LAEMGEGRPDARFDVMSVDMGSSPSVPRGLALEGDGGGGVATPVKPIARFIERWKTICERY